MAHFVSSATLIQAPVSSAITSESLGAHILEQIAQIHGPQLPCYQAREILDGFWERFGPGGMAICDQAFTAHRGMWRGAPITVLRFSERHDPFFAIPLLDEARAAQGNSE